MNKNITPRNDKHQPHGYWEQYHWGGNLIYKCVFINGKVNGFEELYLNNDGKITHKRYHL